MVDEIIEELWRVKDNLAKQFNYGLEALAAELRRRQMESGREVVNLAKQAAELKETVEERKDDILDAWRRHFPR
jgi:hypothetical protein